MRDRDQQRAEDRQALEDWLLDIRYPEAYDLSHAVFASDWLKAHDAKVAADTAERIAVAIEAWSPSVAALEPLSYGAGEQNAVRHAARIARADSISEQTEGEG